MMSGQLDRKKGINSSTRSLLETASVIITGILHIVFVEVLNAKGVFIGIALFGWTTYIAVRTWNNSRLLGVWGIRRDNLRSTSLVATAVVGIGVLAMASFALSRGTLSFHWHMLALFLVYPIWGIIQQFLVQALVAGNLSNASGFLGSAWFVTVVCAVLFGVVHFPDWTLSIGTFFLGLAFTPMYLKWRNLWPLGIYHGWLGVFVYFWVLRRDPWIEVFGRL